MPCNKPVAVSLSEDPCCPLHLRLLPQMYVPEQVLSVPEELEAAPTDLYLSAAELQPTESLPLEFSDVSRRSRVVSSLCQRLGSKASSRKLRFQRRPDECNVSLQLLSHVKSLRDYIAADPRASAYPMPWLQVLLPFVKESRLPNVHVELKASSS